LLKHKVIDMKLKTQAVAPRPIEPTIGYYQPTKNLRGAGGKSGCLCLNRNYYSLKCCNGYLGNQGVGLIYSDVNNVIVEPTP
jgi:hypothetical protein